MKYKKTIILLALVVFLLSIAGVSASEIDNTIASENANTIELSTDNDIEDNLQTSEENEALASTEYDEAIAQTDTEVLGEGSATYSDLANEINQSGNITLTHKSYTYDERATAITISEANKVIDGNGAIIDMNGSTIRAFYISGSGVTIKNLTIKNANYNGNGGAIYFSNSATSGTVSNCNFADNTATFGGAIFFVNTGNVTNCNFTDNTASSQGGAIRFSVSGTVTNCNFTNSSATGAGGAVYFYDNSEVTNCNFIYNVAKSSTLGGGAIFFMISGNVAKCNFTDNSASFGGAVLFGGKGNISNSNFTNNSASNGGGAINMASGSVENCNFTDNKATSSSGGSIWFTGNGDVINCIFTNNSATGDGGAVYFYEGATGRIINCNFTDNTADYGGAVYFWDPGTVTNCNFVNNTASEEGGAVYFWDPGTVSNCNFVDNKATGDDACGGAVYFQSTGNVSNCNFTDNTATMYGGAIFFVNTGNVTNCNFADNSAFEGGAIFSMGCYTTVDTCIFKKNSGDDVNTVIYPPTLNVDNFTTSYGSKEKLTFDLKTNSSIPVTNGNISISVYFKDNGEWVRNYTCLSGEGWIPDLPVGSYIAVFNTEYAKFQRINRTVTITMPNVRYSINVTSLTTNNKTVNITAKTDIPKDILWEGKLLFILPEGTEINATYGGNGTWWAMHKFADYSVYQVNATYEGLDNVTITNGTISISKTPTNITVENETLELFVKDYIATGATLTPADAGNLTFTSSNITVVKVKDGIIEAVGEGSAIITVSFAGSDDYAAADNKTINVTVSLKNASVSVNNATLDLLIGGEFTIVATTTPEGLDVTFTPDNSGVISVDDSGVVTALREGNATVKVKVGGDGVYALNTTDVTVTVKKIPTNITVKNATLELYVEDSIATGVTLTPADAGNVTYTVSNSSVVKVEDGTITAIGGGTAIITVSFAGNDNYTAAENKTITVNVIKYDSKVTISPINDTVYSNNVTIKYAIENKTNVTVTIDGVSDDKIIITNDTITVIGLDAGEYTITVINSESSMYYKSNDTKTFTVNKQATSIAAADVSTTYNINKELVITLKDANGNPLTGASVTVDLNGAKTYTTDKNGQVKVSTKGLAPKAYTAKITFNANTNYDKSTKNVKVTIKKATPKLTAKKKTFKTTTKTKKYTITLKDNTGKAIKKAKVTLKVKGKTYKATTNSKGKAVFKIKNLKKKGTFKATITYKGNKYYNKISKKAKIKVIVTFKTVSKGSKDKSTVKEIQQALKDKGYYLTYQGHYLKVDGKFKGCTERSLKEFQKDNGLKVTGKVDEKTAKKLGIL